VGVILAFQLSGTLLVLALLGLFVFGLRRRLIQRAGGTFDCSLRRPPSADAESPAPSGKGWVYGVARYSGDRVEWFRVFSYAPRPRQVLERSAIEVLHRREPLGQEELALLSDSLILGCEHRGVRLELAMSEDALTGFLSWLESAPPGQHVNVA
jgi:hypothetical protein